MFSFPSRGMDCLFEALFISGFVSFGMIFGRPVSPRWDLFASGDDLYLLMTAAVELYGAWHSLAARNGTAPRKRLIRLDHTDLSFHLSGIFFIKKAPDP